MNGNKNIQQKQDVVKNLNDKSFLNKKNQNNYEVLEEDISENNIVNINFSRNPLEISDKSQPCHTTINLFINDSHCVNRNWDLGSSSYTINKNKNSLTLGKNIPNHTLMRNLLGDLDIKKYSSAPNMNNKNNVVTKKTIPNSTKFNFPINKMEATPRNIENFTQGDSKETTLLYMNDKRLSGNFPKKYIEKIIEEDEDEISVEKEANFMQKLNEEKEQKPKIDPLKRFKKMPTKKGPISKSSGLLQYKTTAPNKPAQIEKNTVPQRNLSSLRVRKPINRENLNKDPDKINLYRSKLLKNQNVMFDKLKNMDFQKEFYGGDNNVGMVRGYSMKPEKPGEITDLVCPAEKKPIHSNRRSVCSIESHGTYEEYRRNLVHKKDGTLCCRNTDYSDDEVWSKAEARNMITSEFVRDKIRRFDKLSKNMKGKPVREYIPKDLIEETKQHEEDQDNFLNSAIYEEISFPKETKNAMARLRAENFKTKCFNKECTESAEYSRNNYRNTEHKDVSPPQRNPIRPVSAYYKRELNLRMAECVRHRPEENIH